MGVVLIKGWLKSHMYAARAGIERNMAETWARMHPKTGGGEGGRFFDDNCNWIDVASRI
jgi:hypothetical protein